MCVERELIEFKVFEKASFDAPSLVDGRLAAGVKHESLPDGLLRLAQVVFDVQLWVPVLLPFDVLDVLQRLKLRRNTYQAVNVHAR